MGERAIAPMSPPKIRLPFLVECGDMRSSRRFALSQGFVFYRSFSQGFAALRPYRSSRVIHDWRGESLNSPQPIVNNSAAPNLAAVNKLRFLRMVPELRAARMTNSSPRQLMSEPRFSLRAVRLGFNESSDADARRLSIRFSPSLGQRSRPSS